MSGGIISCERALQYALLISIKNYTATEATEGLNKILISCGMAVGAVIAAVGLIKLMLSIADENVVAKQQSSLLIGVGIFFLSLSTIINELNLSTYMVSSASGGTIIASRIIEILGKMLTWSGAILCAVAIFMLLLSIANEQAEQKANATKLLGCGIGLLSLKGVTSIMGIYMRTDSLTTNTIVDLVVGFIVKTGTYIGAGFVIMAVWHFIMSVREESSKDRDTAIRFAIVAIALFSARIILKTIGLLPSSLVW